MAEISILGRLSQADREKYLWHVLVECERFKHQKEQRILEVFRYIRDLADDSTVYKAKLRHPYAFAAAETIKASVYPVIFSSDPVAQLVDPNPDNYDRNQISEKILTGLIKNPLKTNFPLAWDRIVTDFVWFGFACPWTYFRSRDSLIGPRFRPLTLSDGQTQATDEQGRPLVEEVYKKIRTYHAPWLEHIGVWDTFIHPDGRRGFSRRDSTGYELLAQAQGPNPIYDLSKVMEMLRRENMSRRLRSTENFHQGSDSMIQRDEMASEAGSEPPRHDEMLSSRWEKDIRAKPFVLLHYDDGEYHGTYACSNGKHAGLRELRFFQGVNYDGSPNRMKTTSFDSPQEIYGTSIIEWTLPLLKLHSNYYRAAADAAALQAHPVFLASQQQRISGSQMIFAPGSVIWTPASMRGNLEEHVKKLDTGADFFNTFQLVEHVQRSLDMAYAQGDPQRGKVSSGRRTAREIGIVAAGAQNRINVLNTKVSNEFAIPLMRKWLAMVTEHYTPRDFVQMLGPQGATHIPPSIEEIVSGLQYVPKGSLTLVDKELRQAQWPAISQVAIQMLPYMQIPHIHELYSRIMEDFGQENSTRVIPSLQDPRITEYMQLVQQAVAQSGGTQGQASPPRSPGDISQLLAQIGGGTAPPGPANGGGVTSGVEGARF